MSVSLHLLLMKVKKPFIQAFILTLKTKSLWNFSTLSVRENLYISNLRMLGVIVILLC